jgi:hypothetical protein
MHSRSAKRFYRSPFDSAWTKSRSSTPLRYPQNGREPHLRQSIGLLAVGMQSVRGALVGEPRIMTYAQRCRSHLKKLRSGWESALLSFHSQAEAELTTAISLRGVNVGSERMIALSSGGRSTQAAIKKNTSSQLLIFLCTGLVKHATRIVSDRVTWLLPVKNGMPHLPETLASIEAQSYGDWQILVWDRLSG